MRVLMTLAVMALTLGCARASQPPPDMSGVDRAITAALGQQLVGTWELVSSRVTRGDSVLLDASAPSLRSYKLINFSHYSVLTLRDGQFMRASTGRYNLSGDSYTEIVELASGAYTPGRAYNFHFRMDGDTWTIDGGSSTERFVEVWRRVR